MGLFRRTSSAYQQLSTDSLSTDAQSRISEQTAWRPRIWAVIVVLWNISLITITSLYALETNFGRTGPTIQPLSCYCGDTISEAKALGCQYDPLSVSWLPPHCRDDELTAEFNQDGPGGAWPYWADREMTQPLTIEQVGELAAKPFQEAEFWTTFGWHISHCSFYWRKEWRMRARGLQVENRYDRESHIKHCHKAFISRTPLNETNTKSAVRLGGERVVEPGQPDAQKQQEQGD